MIGGAVAIYRAVKAALSDDTLPPLSTALLIPASWVLFALGFALLCYVISNWSGHVTGLVIVKSTPAGTRGGLAVQIDSCNQQSNQ